VKVDLEVIDAFIDSEPVDVLDVKDALATTEGRDYLVDAWILRQAVQADLPAAGAVPRVGRASRPHRQWLVAAGIAASLVGGFYAGRLGGTPPGLPAQSPAPVITPTVASGAFPVPAATRVIQLEFNNQPSTTGGD